MRPNEVIRTLARRMGAPAVRIPEFRESRAREIAREFHVLAHNPLDAETAECYAALIREILAQYEAIQALHLKIEAIPEGAPNPYANSAALFADVRENHLWYYPTTSGFGPDEAPGNPLLWDTGERLNGRPLLANDVFRIVHDIFGHCKEGNGFGPIGEEIAWRNHAVMLSPRARRAMTTETRGQNSWVNFGPHGAHNRKNPESTIYAQQKTGLLPEWCSR